MTRDDAGQNAQALKPHPLLLGAHPWLRIHTGLLWALRPTPNRGSGRKNAWLQRSGYTTAKQSLERECVGEPWVRAM